MERERWERGLVERLDCLEGGANARKVGMVGKLELFFVMETELEDGEVMVGRLANEGERIN